MINFFYDFTLPRPVLRYIKNAAGPRLIVVLFWLWPVISQCQIDYEKIYDDATAYFDQAVTYWQAKPADWANGLKSFQGFATGIEPILSISPRLEDNYYRANGYNFRDMARRHIRFMFNCYQYNPTICNQNQCLDMAWNMAENIKSLNFRHSLITTLYQSLPPVERRSLDPLFQQLEMTPEAKQAERIELEISRKMPVYRYLSQLPVSREAIMKTLKPNEVFLSFILMDNRRSVYVWKIESNQDQLIRLKINSADLFLRVEALKAVMEDDPQYLSFLKLLLDYEKSIPDSKNSFAPFLDAPLGRSDNLKVFSDYVFNRLQIQPGKRVIIATDQNVSALPFELLPLASGKLVLEEYDISYVPSAKIFYYLRVARANQSLPSYKTYLGFGYSDHGGLVNANLEIEAAAASFPGRADTVLDATESEVYKKMAQVNRYDIVHFSTHGVVKTQKNAVAAQVETPDGGKIQVRAPEMKTNYLLYGQDPSNDGRLEGKEIVTKMKQHPPLVVLSGCETAPSADVKQYLGLGNVDYKKVYIGDDYQASLSNYISGCVCSYGETFSDLTAAFFSLGTRQVIANQWSVGDEESMRFMQTFFERLTELNDPQKALKQAKVEYIDAGFYDWASFILISD